MAISFPNYLQAALYNPDYSGISDTVENYYKGKNMPKDALIKQIQAEFARPTAEAGLTSTRLSNQSQRLANAKAKLEAQQNAALQAEIAKALGGTGIASNTPAQGIPGSIPGVSQSMPRQVPAQSMPQQPSPNNMSFAPGQDPMEGISNLHPALAQVIQRMRQQQQQQQQQMPQEAAQQPSGAPGMGAAPQSSSEPAGGPNEAPAPTAEAVPNPVQIVTQGEPRLAAVDALWDQNPLSREFLKKKGFEKKTEMKFDSKTGQTRIMTTYPSGKITQQTISSIGAVGGGIPLTNKMISMHQRVISSVDNALPLLQRLKDMESHSNIYAEHFGGNLFATHNQKKYQRLVNAVKENLIGAFALNPTDSGLKTAVDQLTIGGWEGEKDYKKAIQDLINDLKNKKNYSANEVKKSNKIAPIERSGSSEAENMSDEELEAAANG